MIFDQLENARLYEQLTPHIQKAFAFLRRADLGTLALGRHAIDGDNVYAIIQEYETKPVDEAKWEAHRKYLDVQFIASGKERMGYGLVPNFKVVQAYDETKDFLLLTGKSNEVVVSAGEFVIFYPHDAHQPCAAADQPSAVRKVVVKVLVG